MQYLEKVRINVVAMIWEELVSTKRDPKEQDWADFDNIQALLILLARNRMALSYPALLLLPLPFKTFFVPQTNQILL